MPESGEIIENMAAPDFEFAASRFEQRLDKLQEIADRSSLFGDKTGRRKMVHPGGGYLFFPDVNPATETRDQEDKFRVDYRNASNGIYSYLHGTIGSLTGREKKEMEVLVQRYKIHLMPKQEYIPFILGKLIDAIESDPDLKEAINSFKVIDRTEEERKARPEVFPVIVVYARLGKQNAQTALSKIYQALAQYSGLGMDECPRFNQRVNELIYYAQSDGDIKKNYKRTLRLALGEEAERDGGLFEPDFIHFKGDYKLDIPK